jgi:hypothetical protein
MKKQCILLVTLVTLFSVPVIAQTAKTDSVKLKPLHFIRFSPLALVQKEIRLGVEIRTFPRQALIIDGFFTFPSNSERLNSQEGGGVQTDYHFYFTDKSGKPRWYLGLGAMYRRQSLDKIPYTPDFLRLLQGMRDRVSYGAHLKLGVDVQLSKRNRIELFGGIGFRYKSIRENLNYTWGPGDGWKWNYSPGEVKPRLLFGIVLKLQ